MFQLYFQIITLPSEINVHIFIHFLFHYPNCYKKEKVKSFTNACINILLTIPLTDSKHNLFLFTSGQEGGRGG